MIQVKKLIEVVLPIKEISAESVRDKSIRHGHISTLHIWWARRPLPLCRAVVFASLVPDPMDKNCPKAFKDAVEILLGKVNNSGDPYKPYEDIPYTAAIDKMDDNLRNRLLMFIGKFSDRYILNERQGKKTESKDMLSDASLIKWDNKNNEEIINIARKLIWVANNASSGDGANALLLDFEKHYKAIKDAEADLFNTVDRHIESNANVSKKEKLLNAINLFLDKMPKVFDPFAGGGAIPLEASRLGCKSYGNDINPVAHIIQKGSLEFPQKYGKPIIFSKKEFTRQYGKDLYEKLHAESPISFDGKNLIRIPNQLSFDVEFYAKQLLNELSKDISFLYPSDAKGNKPIAYYWVYYAKCSNPSCKSSVPMLKDYYLVNKADKSVYLKMQKSGDSITFSIQHGKHNQKPTFEKKRLICPFCENITSGDELKEQFTKGSPIKKIIAVVDSGEKGKEYRVPRIDEEGIEEGLLRENDIQEEITKNDTRSLWITIWGVNKWGDMYSNRQLYFLNKLSSLISDLDIKDIEKDYLTALKTYLSIWFDKIAAVNTSFGRWNVSGEKIEHPFSRQGIAMTFDFPEVNPFSFETGSSLNMLDWIIRYLNSENEYPFITICNNASSGEKSQFEEKYLTAVVTDPPYYDAVPYADLSDFFYVWQKRTLLKCYPLNFATPKTPKSDECTALKHHHNGSIEQAKKHFENKLLQIFDSLEHQTNELVSIMFAHQSTEAWTTLCNSILGSRMNITGSWAIDTEMVSRTIALAGAALESSVTVSCRPAQRKGYGDYKDVRKAVEKTVAIEVNELYTLGFRGADLLTACFGQAVSEFGKYERVEKADGSEVTVSDLLEMARESAFNALLKGFDGDDFTKFYIGWLQLYGFSESDFDDAAKFSRVGLTINVADLFTHNIFVKRGNKQELAGYKYRLIANHRIGEDGHGFIIDNVHKAMALFSSQNRYTLLNYINGTAPSSENSFWRVLTSLCELLPHGSDDYKQASGLLLNKDSLIRESKNPQKSTNEQGDLF